MNISEKKHLSSLFASLYKTKNYFFVLDYSGIDAKSNFLIRRALFNISGDSLSVVKNKVNYIALKSLSIMNLDQGHDIFKKQNAFVFTDNPIEVIYSLSPFVKNSTLNVKFFCYIQNEELLFRDISYINFMIQFESLNSLKSALLSAMKYPLSSLAYLLDKKSSSVSS